METASANQAVKIEKGRGASLTLDLTLCFVMMLLEGGAKLTRLGRLRHFGKRPIDLLFGVVDVLQRIEEKIAD